MIQISDKVETMFDKWLLNQEHLERTLFWAKPADDNIMDYFNALPFEMQSGVWIAFCESKGFEYRKDYEGHYFVKLIGKTQLQYFDNQISAINQALKLILKTIES